MKVVPVDEIQVYECLNYVEKPVAILDNKMKSLHNKVVPLFKIQWQHWKCSEWTWEPELEIRGNNPNLFSFVDLEDEI